MNSAAKAQFWNDGYVVGSLKLPPRFLEQAKHEIERLDFKPIFGEVYEEERDPFRLQCRIAPFGPATKKIYKRVKGIVQAFDKNWYTQKTLWNALKSLPGGPRQGIHQDFPSFETNKAILEKGSVQASVIVALQPDTQFYVYPGCFGPYADMDKCKLLSLDEGGFIIFRGDLVHAGAEFDEENLRLHCYVRVRGIPQLDDSTEAAVFKSYLCNHCAIPCTSKRHLANHRRYCTDNPNKVESKKARLAADARGGHCDKCNRDFDKRSALHQHNHRRHPKKPAKSNFNKELGLVYQKGMVDDDGGSGNDGDNCDYIESDSSVDAASSDDDDGASEIVVEESEKEIEEKSEEESEYEREEESEEDSEEE